MRGFTLVELIVVMVILGIIATVLSGFITAPTQAYVDSVRRAQLSDAADVSMRRLARDLRLALPNSVRIGGGGRFLEYVPAPSGSRYRAESGGDTLDFAGADTTFDYLGDSLAGETGSVVVFNTGQRSVGGCNAAPGGADVYEGCNRSPISAVSATRITMASIQFPFESPGRRFQIIAPTGPVTIACENISPPTANADGTGTLRLYSNYRAPTGDWGASAPSAAPTGDGRSNNLLVDKVSFCSFGYVGAIAASNGLVTIRLSLTRRGETITLYHQVHIDNLP